MKIIRTSKEDGSQKVVTFEEAVRACEGSGHWKEGTVEGMLKDGLPVWTPFAIYQAGEKTTTPAVDFNKHKDRIRELVKAENEKDQNWKWSVKSISKFKIRINWGYLTYCGEKNGFLIDARPTNEPGEWMICIRNHREEYVNGWFHGGQLSDGTVEELVEHAIRCLGNYARSVY